MLNLGVEPTGMSNSVAAGPSDRTFSGLRRRLVEAFSWRWRFVAIPRIKRLFGVPDLQWMRVVSNRDSEQFVQTLNYHDMDVLEICPGCDRWKAIQFKSYRATTYPGYDLCEGPLSVEGFDLVIAEQVLEHVHFPIEPSSLFCKCCSPVDGSWSRRHFSCVSTLTRMIAHDGRKTA
jgi:hypothetical protein